MNKKLIAVAIASALAAPFAMADECAVTISGNLGASVASVKNTAGDRASDVGSGGSDLSIAGCESLGNGLKAVFLLKSWINLTDNAEGPQNNAQLLGSNKDAYLGLSGNFGTVALGAHGQPYKTATGGLELFGDTIGDPRSTVTNGGAGGFHSGIGDAVIWFLPNMNGIGGHVQYGVENGVDGGDNRLGVQFNYSNGPLYATYAHADDDAGATGNKLGVGYSFGDTTINGIVESIDTGNDVDTFTIGLAQKFGANTAKIQYADNDDASLWAVGVDHNMSKRTKLFAIYADGDNLGMDNGLEVGMAHSF